MKKIHFSFAVLAALVLPMACMAAMEVIDGIEWTYTVSGGKASVGSWYPDEDRAVPTSTTGAIAIPSSLGGYPVTSIGEYAFFECSGLTSVAIPDSVTSIGEWAFSDCSGLTSVTIPDSVTSIGEYAFSYCRGLTSVTIGNSVTSIGEDAFAGCGGMKTFSVASGNPAYQSVSGLLLTKNGKTLVRGVNGDVVMPDSVTSIGDSSFDQCSSLTSVSIPNSVTNIGEWAFSDCSGLTSVTIPDSVTSIGEYAFSYCRGLTNVTIGNSVTSIGSEAFRGCNGLKEIVFCGSVPVGLSGSELPLGSAVYVRYAEEYGAEWTRLLLPKHGTVMNYLREPSAQVDILSAQMRATAPTILDVVYKVTSTNNTVNVRALAFEDGERSFSKVVRPETFVEGTEANLGEGIAANVEHTLSWRVSADWAVDLAKVSFEILVSNEGQLPVELVTIPAAGTNAEMTINVRRPRTDDIFNALLWHYANHAEDLTVVDGELKHGETSLAKNDCPANTTAPIAYVYDKMGYDLLTGDKLEYARMATRWPLSTSGSGLVWVYGRHTVNGASVTEWYQKSESLAYLQYGILRTVGE